VGEQKCVSNLDVAGHQCSVVSTSSRDFLAEFGEASSNACASPINETEKQNRNNRASDNTPMQ
jgi:hypothetical protein